MLVCVCVCVWVGVFAGREALFFALGLYRIGFLLGVVSTSVVLLDSPMSYRENE